MVSGNEYIFENIDEALEYILTTEKKSLTADINRQNPPIVFSNISGMFSQPYSEELARNAFTPVNSLAYPFSAFFNNADEEKFVMTRLVSGRYSLKPNLRHRKYLFRGESSFHSPCKPNLFRNIHQRRFTKELMRGQEMKLLMMSHPLVQLLDIGIELCGKVYRFEMNLYGLAQHYNNKTSLIDLTSDPYVAAFFATTHYDWQSDTYSPIEDANAEPGVLYYYSLDINQDFTIQDNGRPSSLSTIGLQVFPRSGRQKGFLYRLQRDDDFNQAARVYAMRFRHQADISQRIWKQFNGGKSLFPDDILKKHWQKVDAYDVVSNRTIRMNRLHNPDMSLTEVEDEARKLGLEIKDYIPQFTKEEMDEYYESFQSNGLWSEFCQQIHIPGDSGNMMEELKSIPDNPKYRWAFRRDVKHVLDFDQGYLLKMYRNCLS